jgi:hypothetical protein
MSQNFFQVGEKCFYHPKDLYSYLVENCQSLKYDHNFGKKVLVPYNRGKTEYYYIETKFPFRGKFSVKNIYGYDPIKQLLITSHGAIFPILRYLSGIYSECIVEHFPPHERILRCALLNKYKIPVKFTFEKCFYNGSEIENFSFVKTKYITIDFRENLILNDVHVICDRKVDPWIIGKSSEFRYKTVLLPDEKNHTQNYTQKCVQNFEVEFKTVYYFHVNKKYFLDTRNRTDKHFNFNERILFVLRGNKKIDIIDIAQKTASDRKFTMIQKYLIEIPSIEKIAEVSLD